MCTPAEPDTDTSAFADEKTAAVKADTIINSFFILLVLSRLILIEYKYAVFDQNLNIFV